MVKHFLFRFISLLPKLLIISVLIFIGLEMLPGDALTRSVPYEAYGSMTEPQKEMLRESMGLNSPPYIRYFRWLGNLLTGDFGYSIVTKSSIARMFALYLPATLQLALLSYIISGVFGVLLGYISATHQNSTIDYTNTVFGLVGVSIPSFLLGLMAILIFTINLRWFPTGGRMAFGKEGYFDRLPYMVLPALSISIANIAYLMRFTRNSMLDVINKDYIKTARSKGLSETVVNIKHVFRNALIPVMIVLVFRLPFLISGTVIVENVFNYPGVGTLLLSAISNADMPVVLMITLVISASILAASLVSDILIAVLDPRVRFGS